MKVDGSETIPCPCGKCSQCKARRVSGWSFRLMQEDKISSSALFLTLTYDQKHIPLSANKFMTLQKSDVQKFMKRLRKVNTNRLKYYYVGEYGTENKRPHYHMILFNSDVNTISEAWSLGEIHFGTVSAASVGYTLKYMTKEPIIPQHQRDDRIKEFSNMSKGLGLNWLSQAMINFIMPPQLRDSILQLREAKK